jgi:hypothetical protein
MGDRSLSIAGLMRLHFLAALGIGWPLTVRHWQPVIIFTVIMALGTLLAAIVGWRRSGARRRWAAPTLLFVAAGAFVAGYSAFTARAVQAPAPTYPPGTHAWTTLDEFPAVAVVVFGFPLAIAVAVSMLRVWLHSIPDHSA